jgi:vancomycin resistance protein YoaR
VVDVGGEFSFNLTVGKRTEKRGYKTAKIIVNGEFVDGVGGGVCQVSSTLYNAVLLAGLNVIEYHPHSLQCQNTPYPMRYKRLDFSFLLTYGKRMDMDRRYCKNLLI